MVHGYGRNMWRWTRPFWGLGKTRQQWPWIVLEVSDGFRVCELSLSVQYRCDVSVRHLPSHPHRPIVRTFDPANHLQQDHAET